MESDDAIGIRNSKLYRPTRLAWATLMNSGGKPQCPGFFLIFFPPHRVMDERSHSRFCPTNQRHKRDRHRGEGNEAMSTGLCLCVRPSKLGFEGRRRGQGAPNGLNANVAHIGNEKRGCECVAVTHTGADGAQSDRRRWTQDGDAAGDGGNLVVRTFCEPRKSQSAGGLAEYCPVGLQCHVDVCRYVSTSTSLGFSPECLTLGRGDE